MMKMTTTAVRAGIRKRIDLVIEEMITRELMGQAAPPPAIPGVLQQPGAQVAALAPALIAALASQQQQQVPVPQPGLPLATLAPVLAAALAGEPQPIPAQQPQPIATLIAAVACQPQQVSMQQPPSPLATLLPVLMATVAMQQQPARPSPLVSALSCALAPAIASALTGRPREGREREAGEGSPRL